MPPSNSPSQHDRDYRDAPFSDDDADPQVEELTKQISNIDMSRGKRSVEDLAEVLRKNCSIEKDNYLAVAQGLLKKFQAQKLNGESVKSSPAASDDRAKENVPTSSSTLEEKDTIVNSASRLRNHMARARDRDRSRSRTPVRPQPTLSPLRSRSPLIRMFSCRASSNQEETKTQAPAPSEMETPMASTTSPSFILSPASTVEPSDGMNAIPDTPGQTETPDTPGQTETPDRELPDSPGLDTPSPFTQQDIHDPATLTGDHKNRRKDATPPSMINSTSVGAPGFLSEVLPEFHPGVSSGRKAKNPRLRRQQRKESATKFSMGTQSFGAQSASIPSFSVPQFVQSASAPFMPPQAAPTPSVQVPPVELPHLSSPQFSKGFTTQPFPNAQQQCRPIFVQTKCTPSEPGLNTSFSTGTPMFSVQAATPETPFSVSPMNVDMSGFTIGTTMTTPKSRCRRSTTKKPGPRVKPRVPFPQPLFSPAAMEESKTTQESKMVQEPVARSTHVDASRQNPADSSTAVDYTGHRAMIESMRSQAKDHYIQGEYRMSVILYTKALMTYNATTGNVVSSQPDDMRGILLANRAAALLMLGCYDVSAVDCSEAIRFVSPLEPDKNGTYRLNTEGGSLLKAKVYTRMGRALTKMGRLDEASVAFDSALQTVEMTLGIIPRFDASDSSINFLNQVRVDADTGRTEILRCRESIAIVKSCGLRKPKDAENATRRVNLRGLSNVNSALCLSPACIELVEMKLAILGALNRWREVYVCCEKFAANTVKWDGLFVHDLERLNPMKNIPHAKYLNPEVFETDEDSVKLSSKAVIEVLLRLAPGMQAIYIRALRLEERCHPALSAVSVHIDFVRQFVPAQERGDFVWLYEEKEKLERTNKAKDMGDTRFRTADYKGAISQYTRCLGIDSEGRPHQAEGAAGGRLSAVLHCNRAAAFMAMSKFREAINDCTSALKIHPQYMKAMLRKSRCYVRLNRFDEAETEYEQYIHLVEAARSTGSTTCQDTPCSFDGPKEVKDGDLETARLELKEVKRAKINAEQKARAAEAERENQQRWYNDTFGQGRSGNAEQRRENWYSQQGSGSRRWDSFNGKSPNRGSRSKPDAPRQEYARQKPKSQRSWREERKQEHVSSPVTDTSSCHYKVLEITREATEAEIKKAYKKAALKYHPDKNQTDGAVDMFRRIKLAYDVLNDSAQRRAYDNESRWSRRY